MLKLEPVTEPATRGKRIIYALSAAVLAVFLLIECAGVSVYMYAFNRAFYHRQRIANDAAAENSWGFDDEQLDYIMDDLLKYMNGDGRELLDTRVTIDTDGGPIEIEVFRRSGGLSGAYGFGSTDDDIQIRHMKDVKNIFTALKILMAAGAVLIPAAVFGMLKTKKGGGFKRFARRFLAAFGATLGVLLLWALIDFSSIFLAFHLIFFTNTDFSLQYDDILIEMLPESLFMNLAIKIALTFLTLLTAATLPALLGKRNKTKDK
jgi:integral membrane protein (TIGR01906 family)